MSTGQRSCFSSLSKYGLGGHNWKRFSPESYQEIIRQALVDKKISYLEVAGQEGGDIAMVGAIQSAMERSPELMEAPLTVTTRIGYKSLDTGDAAQIVIPSQGDVVLAEQEEADKTIAPTGQVVHNITPDYILQTLEASPLSELQSEMKNLHHVVLLHNPEVQVLDLLKDEPNATLADRQAFIQERWTPAMESLQEYAKMQDSEHGNKVSFGVVSNGLGIPAENNHPMHLDAESVIQAGQTYDKLSTVQLPANLLETHGWSMARKIHSALPSLSVVAMRPLTCYPDLGTGSGHPFRLVDYALPTVDGINPYAPLGNDMGGMANDPMAPSIQNYQYTNEMAGVPAIYQLALQAAMSHFDAEFLLEIKQERELTMEERETLDGCKLVQSMIHDLDSDLETVRSFAAHEEELYGRIIPLLYDTFEAMDDHTSDVLQAYFAAYAVAVRYSIAKKTRQILKEGEPTMTSATGRGTTYSDIPPSMTLQDYALRHLLADSCFDRLVIGASSMQDFVHQTQLMEEIADEDAASPLDAIEKANQEQSD